MEKGGGCEKAFVPGAFSFFVSFLFFLCNVPFWIGGTRMIGNDRKNKS